MKSKVVFSHITDHWATPSNIYNYFINKLGCVDPCPLYCEQDNINKLYNKQRIFINPPYSKIKDWVKFIKNNIKNNSIYLLIPARTDTRYFHELLDFKPYICFIKGRLKFNDKGSAPFPSILMVFTLNTFCHFPFYYALDFTNIERTSQK